MANYYVTSEPNSVPSQYSSYTIIDSISWDTSANQNGYIVSVAEDSNVVIAGDVGDDVIVRTTGWNGTNFNVTTTVLGDTTGTPAGSLDLLINAGSETDVIPTVIVDGDASKFDLNIAGSPTGTSTLTVNAGGSLNSYTGSGVSDDVTINGTIGTVSTGGSADTITIGDGAVVGAISTGNGDDRHQRSDHRHGCVGRRRDQDDKRQLCRRQHRHRRR